MNDFTKEELKSIYDCMAIHGDNYSCGQTAHKSLIDKLQSMIDNYQEIKIQNVLDYCCPKCIEEWQKCECNDE